MYGKETEHGFITKKYVELLEKQIVDDPSQWLWSHRRWKGIE
jgi:KDO2-lipid IV(A) lauroyltransferase